MKTNDISSLLSENQYPGRGIILGLTPDSKSSVMVYFIMGRSVNSRNRVFVSDGEDMRTKAFDPAKLSDPSLVIYYPVRVLDGRTIVTNGDQTDTIYDFLSQNKGFEAALSTREFEPDAPNFTPRISGLLDTDGSYMLSILKSAGGDPACCQRFCYQYPKPIAGQGHFIHTYQCNGSPLPSFMGEPIVIATENDIDSFADKIWSGLNTDNKVSLFVRMRNIFSGQCKTVIINKHEE